MDPLHLPTLAIPTQPHPHPPPPPHAPRSPSCPPLVPRLPGTHVHCSTSHVSVAGPPNRGSPHGHCRSPSLPGHFRGFVARRTQFSHPCGAPPHPSSAGQLPTPLHPPAPSSPHPLPASSRRGCSSPVHALSQRCAHHRPLLLCLTLLPAPLAPFTLAALTGPQVASLVHMTVVWWASALSTARVLVATADDHSVPNSPTVDVLTVQSQHHQVAWLLHPAQHKPTLCAPRFLLPVGKRSGSGSLVNDGVVTPSSLVQFWGSSTAVGCGDATMMLCLVSTPFVSRKPSPL